MHTGKTRENRIRNLAGLRIAAACAAAFFLVSCGRKDSPRQESTVVVSRNGAFSVTSVESFDESLYSREELEQRIDEELKALSTADGEKSSVEFVKLEVKNGKAALLMNYDSASDYASFNDTVAYFGTVHYASLEGYDLSPLLSVPSQVESDVLLSSAELERLGNHSLVIISEPVLVELPSDIMYCTENARVTDKRKAAIQDAVSELNPAMFILK
ncbi:MAG: hypothetical protein II759_04455 [Lachnospiraceae bacterium]|nr:hypothetical protein [Lachnospiraceae bacterium]